MKINDLLKKNFKNEIRILLLSFAIISLKWLILVIYNKELFLLNYIIFDINDIYYLPFIINLSQLNLFPNYLLDELSSSLITAPITSIMFHSLFLKIFGLFSFLFLEIIFLFFFIYLISKIFELSGIDFLSSIKISLFLLCIPIIFQEIQLFNINLKVLNNFFSFRIPRPLVTSCYFLWALYLSFLYYLKEEFSQKNYIFLSISLSLLLSSYYYNFINIFILLFFILILKIYKAKNKKIFLKDNSKKILISTFFFLFFSIPFFIILFFSEKDTLTMYGLTHLDHELKLHLIKYLLNKIFSFKFLLTFLIISFLMIFIKKLTNNNYLIINFLYLLYLSLIISPFFFIILSNSFSEFYNFLNWILIISYLTILFYLFLIIKVKKTFFTKYLSKKINFFLIVILIITYQFFYFMNYKSKNDTVLKNDYIELYNFIKKNENLKKLLSFSIRPQVFWLLNDKRIFTSVESSISTLNFKQLENNFFKNLKFLNISEKNFMKLISNKKTKWRFDNKYIKYISWYKYQANSLVTFEKSRDFSNEELSYINRSSPILNQQIILPNYEINRMVDTFNNIKITKNNFIIPDIIIFDNDEELVNYSSIDLNIFCKIKNFKKISVYVIKSISVCEN